MDIKDYESLKPFKLKNISLKSRIIMPPMATYLADENDHITDEAITYYVERAKFSNVGLIIVEHQYINKQGKAHLNQLSIADDTCIESLSKLTSLVHKEGVKIIAQISHSGSTAKEEITDQMVVAPSDIVHPRREDGFIPMEMSFNNIGLIIKWFVEAALRAQLAGFDGVEIHAAHGYLLNQFYSPLTNKRVDEYGYQLLSNRIRLHREIIKAIKQNVDKDFIVAIRFGGCDYVEGGSTILESIKACKLFEKDGVDLIDISGGIYGYSKSNLHEFGYFKDMTSLIKKEVNVPIILTGGVTKLEHAEELINNNDADLIGIGRALLKNAKWY